VLGFWSVRGSPSRSSFPWLYRPNSGSTEFLVGWDGNAKGGEESVMHIEIHLTSLPPRRDVQTRGGERGLVGVMLGEVSLGTCFLLPWKDQPSVESS